jgi:hypothetical protein
MPFERHRNVENGLGSKSRYGGAADMLNVRCHVTEQRDHSRPFRLAQIGPGSLI